ncbi:MAG: DUF4288 domain-containing protein [Deltaproteobacteria bacterium]|nr:DUF4288 domain-containing protein [Deltaproteobacteria bacterium]
MWYTVNLFFKASYSPVSRDNPLWEERIVVIEAETEEEAKLKAIEWAKDEEHEYEVGEPPGGRLRWSFEHAGNVSELESNRLSNGMEVFSRFLKNKEAVSLITPFDD